MSRRFDSGQSHMNLKARLHSIKNTWDRYTIFFDNLMEGTEEGDYPWEPYHMNVKDYFEANLLR